MVDVLIFLLVFPGLSRRGWQTRLSWFYWKPWFSWTDGTARTKRLRCQCDSGFIAKISNCYNIIQQIKTCVFVLIVRVMLGRLERLAALGLQVKE